MSTQIHISTDKQELDVAMIHRFLSQEAYWSLGIPLATVEAAIAGSMCFGMYLDGRQIAFARLITDAATFAYLCDVFVLPEQRGRGYGQQLVQYIMQQPVVQGLRRLVLVTRDAHELYRPLGFAELTQPEGYMELRRPNIYRRQATSTDS